MNDRGEGMAHPGAVLAVVVLLANDHWGKAAFPGLVTGKLSDFAGLAFFPLFLQGVLEVAGAPVSRRVLAGTCVATAAVFAAVKASAAAGLAWAWTLGTLQWPFLAAWSAAQGSGLPPWSPVRHAVDPTDLVALPAVLLAWVWGRGRAPTAPPARPATRPDD